MQLNLDIEPSEVIIKLVFKGRFIPPDYGVDWLIKRSIVSRMEESRFRNVTTTDSKARYSFGVLNFEVEPTSFDVYITNKHSIPILIDMGKTLSRVQKIDLDDKFDFDFYFHFDHKSGSKVKKGLEMLAPSKPLKKVLNTPKTISFSVSHKITQKTYSANQSLQVSKCGKYESGNQIHLYVRNEVLVNKISKIASFEKEFSDLITKSAEIANFINNTYF